MTAMTSIRSIKGFRDILPGETELWQSIEKTAAEVLEAFGFREIRLPLLEKTVLFARSIGEATDIVEKEMYTFTDRSGDLLTLRPEATAAVVRAYLQHKIYAQDPVQKYYTIGPMFRRERPQKGRYRQFYQINAEIFGAGSPYADVQLIVMLVELLDRLGVADAQPHVNSLGCPTCRPAFRRALLDFLSSREARLCADCLRRRETNPLRILDCKVPDCRETSLDAPALSSFLCPECRSHFDILQGALDELGIAYLVDKRLVRGLDYYSRTTFEIQTSALGAQSAVAGGGRYDGLMKTLGGPDIPATGFAIGFDRLAEIVAAASRPGTAGPQVFIAALGAEAQARAFPWLAALNRGGITADMLFEDKSLKSLMKRAGKLGARQVLIIGENELAANTGQLRDMTTREQVAVPLDRAVEELKQRLGVGG